MFGYNRWKQQANNRLGEQSQVAKTAMGPIQYATVGNGGPAIILNSGIPGGFDQGMLMAFDMLGLPYTFVGWSRPGYMGTPAETGHTLEDYIELQAALMDALSIQSAAIYGASGGGPVTYGFAAKYPDRVWAVLGECAVSKNYNMYANTVSRLFADIFLSNYGSYWLTRMAKSNPNAAIKTVVTGGSKLKGSALNKELKLLYDKPEMIEITRELFSSMSPMNNRKAGMNKDVEICRAIKELNLEAITAPTLIIHGLMDHDVDFSHAENAHNRIKGSDLMVIPTAGHVIPISSGYKEYVERKHAFFEKYRP